MKRWILNIENKEYQPLIYAETPEEAKQYFKDENVIDVASYDDYDYLNDIDYLKKNSNYIIKQNDKNGYYRELYDVSLPDGKLNFQLSYCVADETYIDFAIYQFVSKDKLMQPVTYTMSTPKQIRDKFFRNYLSCEVVSYRLYGQPKLNKPSELKGIKQSFSVDFIPNKCKCQCYVKGNDLWVKHRDFFSKEHRPEPKDIGTPLTFRLEKYFGMDKKYLDKFVYPDSWGSIILRNEAWIVFRNLKQSIKRTSGIPTLAVAESFFKSEFLVNQGVTELNGDWKRFFEKMCVTYADYLKKENM